MYLLKVKTHNGVNAHLIESEAEAIRRMRHWRKHPTYIDATVQRIGTYTVPYAVTIEVR